MLSLQERSEIIKLIKQEVIPAIGCTEPVAVALAVAKATEILGAIPDKIEVSLSSNMLKNAMGVGIPGTGMVGLPIAIALGALIGKSEYGLEVLKDLTPEALEQGKKMIDDKVMTVYLKQKIAEKLYIEVLVKSGNDQAQVIISHDHTRFSHIQKNEEILLHLADETEGGDSKEKTVSLSFNKVCDFAIESPVDELRFILKSSVMNRAASNESMKGQYGHSVAQTVHNGSQQNVMGNTIFTRMLSVTAAACDARMAGAMFPVMSNSGSGNQGIAATLPVSVFAEETGKSEDELIHALALSHLMTIYIKQSLGRLSGLCGAIVAATGSACGITYLMGGTRDQIAYSIKNMIGNITGMICDGAKPSCALKVSNGVSTATLSALMAMDNKVVTSIEGITDEDVDKTILNLTKIGSEGMNETDRMVLEIMTTKGE
ncbi:MAG TPA: L-serine ammonia-lyase, iron-sulfur-dependent, subunit alpha, partial [Paludibacter sp.]|nr:L-serine ammonia-lyase, iron-sulfur-dependent, subunit alpha [Paludibacter sp.]